ncbi:MAG: O-succinylhomoserine sulfhydrylase [Alphaproteobacteria bacterium]
MKKKKSTSLVHSGTIRTNFMETSESLFLTSGYIYKDAEEAEMAFQEKTKRYMYSRFNNPTVEMLQNKLASIEGAEACWTTSTGMAAVFSIFMSYLKKGDRVVAGRALFGSCHFILTKILPKFGIDVELVDGKKIESWKKALKKKTNMIFFETPSNPCLEIIDIEAVVKLAKKDKALVVVDNVFATPVLQNPLQFGADVVMYSATKHIDGHGRVLGGAILGKKKYCDEVLKPFIRNTGPSISPFNAWVLTKSLDTLKLRVEKQTENAKRILEYLEKSKFIKKIYYPFLNSSSQLSLAKKQMSDGGSIISFEINAKSNNEKKIAFAFLNNLSLISISNNLGDTKSLITHPETTTHCRLSNSEKMKLGIKKNLIRLSVGLEDYEDIINDIDRSLKKTLY